MVEEQVMGELSQTARRTHHLQREDNERRTMEVCHHMSDAEMMTLSRGRRWVRLDRFQKMKIHVGTTTVHDRPTDGRDVDIFFVPMTRTTGRRSGLPRVGVHSLKLNFVTRSTTDLCCWT